MVNLRDGVLGADGLSGNIIAQSLPLTIIDAPGSHFFRFYFPTMIPLIPGHTYVAELRLTNLNGEIGVRHTQGNSYAGGQFLHQDFAPDNFTNTDLVFAEGIATPVPEPETYAMLLVGLGLIGFMACRRKYNV